MTVEHVPLGTGPPTLDEVRIYYPPKFTWWQLKLFINAGCVGSCFHVFPSQSTRLSSSDLGLLKRHKKLQLRYAEWGKKIRAEYGSVGEFFTGCTGVTPTVADSDHPPSGLLVDLSSAMGRTRPLVLVALSPQVRRDRLRDLSRGCPSSDARIFHSRHLPKSCQHYTE